MDRHVSITTALVFSAAARAAQRTSSIRGLSITDRNGTRAVLGGDGTIQVDAYSPASGPHVLRRYENLAAFCAAYGI